MINLKKSLRKEYLLLKGAKIESYAFTREEDLKAFLRKAKAFSFTGPKIRDYLLLIANPLGEGEHSETKEKGLLYGVYGVAAQSKDKYLLGRRIPPQMNYDLTLKKYNDRFHVTQHYALSDDHLETTEALLGGIIKSDDTQVNGAIVDHDEKIILLTSVLPEDLQEDLDQAREEIKNGRTKSKNKNDTVELVEKVTNK